MDKVKVPVGFAVGGAEDFASAQAHQDFELLAPGIPGYVASRATGDHTAVSTDSAILAEVAEIGVNWIDYAVSGNETARQNLVENPSRLRARRVDGAGQAPLSSSSSELRGRSEAAFLWPSRASAGTDGQKERPARTDLSIDGSVCTATHRHQAREDTMGKLIVTEFMTLDGVAQAPGGPDEERDGGFAHGGWQAPLLDQESGSDLFEQARSMDALLLGRKTYEIFADYWPRAPEEIPFTGLLDRRPQVRRQPHADRPARMAGLDARHG